MPRPKKAPGMAVDPRNGQRVGKVMNQAAVPRFDPPPGLIRPAEEAWEAYWIDRPAQLLTPVSKVILLRWIDALNRYMIYVSRADRETIVESGANSATLSVNPLYRVADQALRTVEMCEKQLGIGVLNATALGLAALAEARSITDLNARYSQPESETTQEAPDEQRARPERDPRLDL